MKCGQGQKTREVVCLAHNRTSQDCRESERPSSNMICHGEKCQTDKEDELIMSADDFYVEESSENLEPKGK